MSEKAVLFFKNGNTAVCIDEKQVPELQHPWILVFVEFLESQGQDPTTFEYLCPDGTKVRVFKTETGWSWQ